MTSQQDRVNEAQELVQCIAEAFRALKALTPDGNPWAGNMLATEHIRQLGTSIYIQLTRRREWGSSPPPVATAAPGDAQDGQRDLEGGKAAREASTATHGPARGDPVEPPAFGATRTDRKTHKPEWYAGLCVKCGKPAWVRFPVDPLGGQPEGTFTCLTCWKAGKVKA